MKKQVTLKEVDYDNLSEVSSKLGMSRAGYIRVKVTEDMKRLKDAK